MSSIQGALTHAVAQTLARLPDPLARRLPAHERGDRVLDPRLALLMRMSAASGSPPLRNDDVRAARANYERIAQTLEAPVTPVGAIRDELVEGPGGPMRVRVHHPASFRRILPVVVYVHGGGFVLGSLDTHEMLCRRLARASGAAVIAIDYRLAPEHPMPAAIDDLRHFLDALEERAHGWKIDPSRVAVAGDSAGGNLCAVVSPGRALRMQLLYYPVTDGASRSESRALYAAGYGLEGADVDFFSTHYAPGIPEDDPQLSPFYGKSLAESPPTRLVVAGFDLLRDEGIEFANRLQERGVDTTLIERPQWTHGFVHMGALPGVAASIDEDGMALAAALR